MPPPSSLPPFPSFLIIGAQRCATRWLKVNLNKHPSIYAPPFEIDFWNDPERRAAWTMNGYRRKFEAWSDEPIIGEASPSYMFFEEKMQELEVTAKVIWKQIPDVRIIALVRDPVDRFESALRNYVKTRRLPRDFDVFADWQDPAYTDLHLIQAGQYAASLEPYLYRFGDQVKIVFLDDVRADPAGVYRDVLAHIGAPDDFVPKDVGRPLFSTASSVSVKPMTVEQRNLVRTLFLSSIEKLETLTGRDLTDWKTLDT